MALLMFILCFAGCGVYSPDIDDSLKTVEVGDTIEFGHYEQDNNTSNGKEIIEWIVLAKNSDTILVISKYALDCREYNKDDISVNWETCSLRKWMNGSFVNSAFSSGERKMIAHAVLPVDKVFLLSVPEANKFFSSNVARKCEPTEYAIAQDTYVFDDNTCLWWLRSSDFSDTTGSVDSEGAVLINISSVQYSRAAIRPAICIRLGN